MQQKNRLQPGIWHCLNAQTAVILYGTKVDRHVDSGTMG